MPQHDCSARGPWIESHCGHSGVARGMARVASLLHSTVRKNNKNKAKQLILSTKTATKTSCRRAAATICPHPGLQRKPASAALSQAGRAGPDQPIRAIQSAGRRRRPPTGCTRQTSDVRQTDVRQQHRLMPPGRGHNRTDDITLHHIDIA